MPTEDRPAVLAQGDALEVLRTLPDSSVHCCVTSPPYWSLRDYGVDGQIGLEKTPEAFVARLVEVFREVRRVLHPSGTLWVNMGDSYYAGGWECRRVNVVGNGSMPPEKRKSGVASGIAGLKPKDLVGIPWRLAFALQEDGWFLRSAITLCKLSPMPESVRDRPTQATEMMFMLSKRGRYFYDDLADRRLAADSTIHRLRQNIESQSGSHRANGQAKTNGPMKAVGDADAGSNLWNYWPFRSAGTTDAHFATFHEDLPERCILLSTSAKGVCPTCLSPWARKTEKDRKPTRPGENTKVRAAGLTGGAYSPPGQPPHSNARLSSDVVGNRDPQRHCTTTTTTGWAPTCKCNAGEPIPATVLDPFVGSGTTLAVTAQHGRWGIGIDLNGDYLELAKKRISEPVGVGGLFGPESVTVSSPDLYGANA